MKPIVLLVGHGSREPDGQAELVELVAAYQAWRPDLEVTLGCVELQPPPLAAALDRVGARAGAAPVVVVPLFLFAAGHVKHDVPEALAAARRRHPGARFVATPALGIARELLDLAADRARLPAAAAPGTALVVVGRGSSDADANGDLCKVCRLLGEGRGFAWVQPAFIGITRPLLPEALDACARLGHERLLVLPYFLFTGRLMHRLAAQVEAFRARHPGIEATLAPHLGVDARLLALVDARVRAALGGRRA
jgi:sirohydrochlorin ferrochelatase